MAIRVCAVRGHLQAPVSYWSGCWAILGRSDLVCICPRLRMLQPLHRPTSHCPSFHLHLRLITSLLSPEPFLLAAPPPSANPIEWKQACRSPEGPQLIAHAGQASDFPWWLFRGGVAAKIWVYPPSFAGGKRTTKRGGDRRKGYSGDPRCGCACAARRKGCLHALRFDMVRTHSQTLGGSANLAPPPSLQPSLPSTGTPFSSPADSRPGVMGSSRPS